MQELAHAQDQNAVNIALARPSGPMPPVAAAANLSGSFRTNPQQDKEPEAQAGDAKKQVC